MTRSARRPQRRTIGPYEIVAELAATCALGTLWLGSARGGPRRGEPLLFRRILAEPGVDLAPLCEVAERARGVVHDAWLHVDAIERDDDELVVVSDYVEGDLAASLLRIAGLSRRPLPVAVALRIAADACEGLAALHAETDLLAAPSPESLWIGTDGRARLLEPGLHAAAAERAPWRESAKRASYDAPERFEGAADARSDVFAIGVVLWEMLRNRRLFGGASLEALRARSADPIRRVDAPPGGERIAPDVADLVERAVARDPAERFQSAAELREALEEMVLAEPWDVAAFLDEVCRDEVARQRRLVDEAVRADGSGPASSSSDAPAPSSRRPGALLSARPPATAPEAASPSGETPSPARSFDEALIVSPDSFSPTSTRRDALDSFETLVAAEGIAHEPDDDDFDALGLALEADEPSEPPESERRPRARAIDELEPADEALVDAPPASGPRRASSAPPESGRRRASGAYLEVPVASSRPPPPPRRGLAPVAYGAMVAIVGIVVGFLVFKTRAAPPAAPEASSADVPPAGIAPPGAPSAGVSPARAGASPPTASVEPVETSTAATDAAPAEPAEPAPAATVAPKPPAPARPRPAPRPAAPGSGTQPKYTPGDI